MLTLRLLAVSLGLASAVAASDPFEVTTPGKAGSGGLVPALTGSGSGTPGSSGNALLLDDAFPGGSAIFVLGLSELGLPFKGGVLGPAPDKLIFGPTVDAGGSFTLPFSVPAELPAGLSTWNQFWIDDPGAFLGRSASNTLRFTVQEPVVEVPLFHAAEYAVHTTPPRIVVADFDGDGAPDVATSVGGFDPGVSVLFGSEGGLFEGTVFTDFVTGPSATLVEGAVNGDGARDLVVYAFGAVTSLLADGDGRFTPLPASQAVGDGVVDLLLVDLDADGFDDLVTLHPAPNQAQVRRGVGDGRFRMPITVPVFVDAERMHAADMDGDGVLDLVIVHDDLPGPSGGAVTVLLGVGDGTFGASTAFAAGSFSRDLAVGDLDGDGVLDAVALNVGSEDVSVFLGQGDGSLVPTTTLPVGVDPTSLLLLDADGDGALDVAVTNETVAAVALFLGDGAGGLTPTAPLPLADEPRALHLSDVDADGVQDLVVLQQSGDRFAVLLGLDGGGFGVSRGFPAGATTDTAIAAQLDADGLPDVVTIDRLADQVLGLTNLGDGSLGAPVVLADLDQVGDVAVGDLNGDTHTDLVVAHTFLDAVHLVFGSASGFGEPQPVNNGRGKLDLTITDVDLDGVADIVSLDPDDGDDAAVVLLGLGGGAFAPPVTYPVGGDAIELLVGDVNGDDVPDVITTLLDGPPRRFSVLLGQGDGSFAAPLFTETDAQAVASPLLTDFDGDGAPELVLVLSGADSVSVHAGGGDGSFGPPTLIQVGTGPERLAAGDVDGDGVPDLLVSLSGEGGLGPASGAVAVLRGTGDGGFRAALRFGAGGSEPPFFGGPRDLALADFDADGRLDVAVANEADDAVVLLINQRSE